MYGGGGSLSIYITVCLTFTQNAFHLLLQEHTVLKKIISHIIDRIDALSKTVLCRQIFLSATVDAKVMLGNNSYVLIFKQVLRIISQLSKTSLVEMCRLPFCRLDNS